MNGFIIIINEYSFLCEKEDKLLSILNNHLI